MKRKRCWGFAKYELALLRSGTVIMDRIRVNKPIDVVEAIKRYLKDAPVEKVVVVGLDGKNEIIGLMTAGTGTLNHCFTEPRAIFEAAFSMRAQSMVVAHNHPQDGPEPSEEDLMYMKNLVRMGQDNSCPLKDFIIIGEDNTHWSMRNDTLT